MEGLVWSRPELRFCGVGSIMEDGVIAEQKK